jgi:predicted nucleotidyltransferase
MTDAVIARRRSEREERIGLVREWAQRAGPVLEAEAIAVVGSVARGDFNKWSDIDVLIVAPHLPPSFHERLSLLAPTRRPPGVEAILWTPEELARRTANGKDPLAREFYEVGVVVYGRLRA